MKRTKNRLKCQTKPVRLVVKLDHLGPSYVWDGLYRPLLDHEQAMIRRELTGVNEKPCGRT